MVERSELQVPSLLGGRELRSQQSLPLIRCLHRVVEGLCIRTIGWCHISASEEITIGSQSEEEGVLTNREDVTGSLQGLETIRRSIANSLDELDDLVDLLTLLFHHSTDHVDARIRS